MKVIGLTGGIGSGKSTVSRLLAELGAVIINADEIGHEVFKSGTEAWQEIVDAFGRQILTPGGEIDRAKLGELVFKNPESRLRLNRIMHPRIYQMLKSQIERYRRQGVDVVVIEVVLLLEVDWSHLADEVWVTIASEDTALRRLADRPGLSKDQARARIRSQMSNEERIRHADVVINNDGDISTLKAKVKELWDKLHT